MRIALISAILFGAASLLLGQPNINTGATTVNGVLTPNGLQINPNQGVSIVAVFQDQGAGLSYAFFTFETFPAASYSCKVGVQIGSPVSTSNIFLHDDTGASLGPMWFGSGSQENNSKCALNVTGTNVTLSGGQYTVTVNIVFKDPYNGVKYTWLNGYDNNGAATGWVYGNANFEMRTQDYAPQTVTVSPSSGSNQAGQTQQFSYTTSDTNGAFTIYHTELVFNKGPNWIPGYQPTTRCKIVQDNNLISLENDAQSGFVSGSYTPFGSPQPLSNSQCTVYPSSSIGTANSLVSATITFAVSFTPSFTGQLQDHIFAADNLGSNTWDSQADGIWTWIVGANVNVRIDGFSVADGLVGFCTNTMITGTGLSGNPVLSSSDPLLTFSITSVLDTVLGASICIPAGDTDGLSNVFVTSFDKKPGSITFNKQLPGSLVVKSARLLTAAENASYGCPSYLYGGLGKITYEVRDRSGRLITQPMLPVEKITQWIVNFFPPANPYPNFVNFSGGVTTDSNGRFDDVPFGTCATGPSLSSDIQTIGMRIGGVGGINDYVVRTNNWSYRATSPGIISMTNSDDIILPKP